MIPRDVSIMLWCERALHEVSVRYDGQPITIWIPCDRPRAFERQLDAPECWISAVPRTTQTNWMTGVAPILWCYLQTRAAAAALMRFRPPPSFVLRAGSTPHRWALWPLSKPLRGAFIEQATERLSYALHGLRRAARTPTLIPSPFSAVCIGPKLRQMFVEYEQPVIYTARQVVGHLRDAPRLDRSRWQQRTT